MSEEPVSGPARNGAGRFTRSLANISRDREAAEAVERGATYEEVAERFGYHDRGAAHRAVMRIRRENAMYSGATREIRQRLLDEMAQVRRHAWDLVLNPLPAVSRTGKVVTDDEGNEVPDAAGVAAMLALIVRASEREARLTGADMPRRSVSLSGKSDAGAVVSFLDALNPGDLTAAIREMRRRVEEEDRAIPGAVED